MSLPYAEVFDAIEVLSEDAWRLRGDPTIRPTSSLASALTELFFQRRGLTPGDVRIDAGRRRRRTAALLQAIKDEGFWQSDWEVVAIEGREITAKRDGLVFVLQKEQIHPDDSPSPGVRCRVRAPRVRLDARPGFLRLCGAAGDLPPGKDVVQATWNLRAEGVEPWLRAAAAALDAECVPYRLETPTSPELDLGAADVVVALHESVLQSLAFVEIYRAASPHLRSETPLGLLHLAPGSALAHGEKSVAALGSELCRALADELLGRTAQRPRISPEKAPPFEIRTTQDPRMRRDARRIGETSARELSRSFAHQKTGCFFGVSSEHVAGTLQPDWADGLAGLQQFRSELKTILGLETTLKDDGAERYAEETLGTRLRRKGNPTPLARSLDVFRGELGIAWALCDVEPRASAGSFSDLLENLEKNRLVGDGWTICSVLDLSYKIEDRLRKLDPDDLWIRPDLEKLHKKWIETSRLEAALRIFGERLRGHADAGLEDRILTGDFDAHQAAGYAAAFLRLFEIDSDENWIRAARRALDAEIRPARRRSCDAVWRFLVSLRAEQVDLEGAAAHRARRDASLREILDRLRLPVCVHDADLSSGSGVCLLLDAALEASRLLGDIEARRVAEKALAALLERHGDPLRWPTPLRSPTLFSGFAGVVRTVLRFSHPDLSFLWIPTWDRPWKSARIASKANAAPDDENRSTSPQLGKILDVPLLGQMKDLWCWAATEQMIRCFLGDRCTQEEIVSGRFEGELRNEASWPPFRTLRRFLSDEPLAWDGVRREIDAGYPFAFAWRHRTGGGHVQVASGYFELDAPDLRPDLRRWVIVHDPWPPRHGDASAIPYAHYLRGAFRYRRTYLLRRAGDPPPREKPLFASAAEIDAERLRLSSSSWEAAVAAGPVLAASRKRIDGNRRTPIFPAVDVDGRLRIVPRPILSHTVFLDQLRRRGADALQERPDEAIFPVEVGETLVGAVTVGRRDEGWALQTVGRSHLASALFSLDAHGLDLLRRPWGVHPHDFGEKYDFTPPQVAPSFAMWIPELYELFLGVEADWPRSRRYLVPVYGSERLGLRRGEAFSAEKVFEALAEAVEDPSLDPTF